eukprot:TRINITY_DN14700_c0_g1_i1.p1 TRINITY_DN14700_c0_g1~~TRINITY_DN14700_c0_g1_i1.p1  ORF type:complete len:704 (+),score=126.95 TRINITY_DN14700_c0_g1_i1:121-2232(+)
MASLWAQIPTLTFKEGELVALGGCQAISGILFAGLTVSLLAKASFLSEIREAPLHRRLEACALIMTYVAMLSTFFNILRLAQMAQGYETLVVDGSLSAILVDSTWLLDWVFTCPLMQLVLVLWAGGKVPTRRWVALPTIAVSLALFVGLNSLVVRDFVVRITLHSVSGVLAVILLYFTRQQILEFTDWEEGLLTGGSAFRTASLLLFLTWVAFPLWLPFSRNGGERIHGAAAVFSMLSGSAALHMVARCGIAFCVEREKAQQLEDAAACSGLFGLRPDEAAAYPWLSEGPTVQVSLDALVQETLAFVGLEQHSLRLAQLLAEARVTSCELLECLDVQACGANQLPWEVVYAMRQRLRVIRSRPQQFIGSNPNEDYEYPTLYTVDEDEKDCDEDCFANPILVTPASSVTPVSPISPKSPKKGLNSMSANVVIPMSPSSDGQELFSKQLNVDAQCDRQEMLHKAIEEAEIAGVDGEILRLLWAIASKLGDIQKWETVTEYLGVQLNACIGGDDLLVLQEAVRVAEEEGIGMLARKGQLKLEDLLLRRANGEDAVSSKPWLHRRSVQRHLTYLGSPNGKDGHGGAISAESTLGSGSSNFALAALRERTGMCTSPNQFGHLRALLGFEFPPEQPRALSRSGLFLPPQISNEDEKSDEYVEQPIPSTDGDFLPTDGMIVEHDVELHVHGGASLPLPPLVSEQTLESMF